MQERATNTIYNVIYIIFIYYNALYLLRFGVQVTDRVNAKGQPCKGRGEILIGGVNLTCGSRATLTHSPSLTQLTPSRGEILIGGVNLTCGSRARTHTHAYAHISALPLSLSLSHAPTHPHSHARS